MSDYRVEFGGRLAAGIEPTVVQQRLLQIFKGNEEMVKRFMSGRRIVVRDGLDRDTALKYKVALERAGVPVNVVPKVERELELTMEEPAEQDATPEAPKVVGAPPPVTPIQPPAPGPAKAGAALNLAAVLVIVMIAASLGLRFWSSNKLDHFVGVDHVAANGDRVAIQAAGNIYLASSNGHLETVINLEDFGLSGDVADLEVLDDGNMLIGDLEAKKVVRCDPATRNCVPMGPSGEFELKENFKFLADEPRHLLFIADTNNDRLLIEDLTDSSCRLATTSSRLSYPNDLARDPEDGLFLCDTNKFRVISLKIDGRDVYEKGRPFAAVAGMPASPDEIRDMLRDPEQLKKELANLSENLANLAEDGQHAKPYAMAMGPSGNLWVVQLNTMMTNGALKIFTPEGESVGTVTLPEGAVPIDLVRSGLNFIVADEGLEKVYAVDSSTQLSSDFGDGELQDELADIAASRSHLAFFKSAGLVGAVLFGLCALVVTVVAKKQGVA